eukprot:716602-Alexandrium_andersonii.AAC.1
MSASLVGSEMCIRDRPSSARRRPRRRTPPRGAATYLPSAVRAAERCEPVSYTHLTLPTICSV